MEDLILIACTVSQKGPKAGMVYSQGIKSIRRKPAGIATPEASMLCGMHLLVRN